MIKELSELGKKNREQNVDNKVIHNALKEEPVSIDLVINEDGSFSNFISFDKKPTTAEAITAKKGKARLLLDKAEEVLGYGGESSNKKHKLFLDKLEQYKDLTELKPVLLFYGKNKEKGLTKALIEFEKAIPDEKERKGNIAFRLKNSDNRIHEEQAVVEKIIELYEKEQSALLNKLKKKCSVCGRDDYPVVDLPHGMIKKVPAGQTSGCALVSYNNDAFESYELKGNNNSAICTNCAKTYVEGLNWLLSAGPRVKNDKGKEYTAYTNRKNFGSDTAMVFWTRKNEPVNEINLLDTPTPQEVANLIDSVVSGQTGIDHNIEIDQFYSCTLSGSAARIAVRDWIETSLIDFRKAIAQWFQDIAIGYYDSESKKNVIYYSRLYNLAKCCQKEKEDKDITLSRIAMYLWNAALKNTIPPLWILTAVLKRARLDKNGVTPERAALIKLILNRNFKGGDFMVQEKLDPDNKNTAYICGRIFAVLESLQYHALGETNAGIRERFFSSASLTPATAFARLLKMSQHHLSKLKSDKPGLAVNMDKELQSLICDLQNLPATFSLEEQGQFAIGYYHQRQKQFQGTEKKETLKEE